MGPRIRFVFVKLHFRTYIIRYLSVVVVRGLQVKIVSVQISYVSFRLVLRLIMSDRMGCQVLQFTTVYVSLLWFTVVVRDVELDNNRFIFFGW